MAVDPEDEEVTISTLDPPFELLDSVYRAPEDKTVARQLLEPDAKVIPCSVLCERGRGRLLDQNGDLLCSEIVDTSRDQQCTFVNHLLEEAAGS